MTLVRGCRECSFLADRSVSVAANMETRMSSVLVPGVVRRLTAVTTARPRRLLSVGDLR
jgi:hypothetical protein